MERLKYWKNQLSPTFGWESAPKRPPTPGLHLPDGCHIPDWRQYKVSEFTPDLQLLEKRLAAKGLKDPWIRNNVWRCDTRLYGTKIQRHAFIWRGLASGLLLTAVLIGLTEVFWKDEHGHDEYPLLKEKHISKSHHH